MTSMETHSRQLGLTDYLAILNRRKWVIVQSTIIVAVVAFFLSAQQAKVFAASAEVLLTRQTLSNVVTGFTSPDVFADPARFAETQASLARAPEVSERALDKAGLSRTSELFGGVGITPRGDADLLRFTAQSSDPDAATRLANAYAEAFTEYKFDFDTRQLVDAREDLQLRIGELREQGQTASESYRELVDSAQQLRTMELLQTPNLVVTTATGAGQIAPTPNRNAMLGAFVGLLLGLGIAFLWETLDKRVRTEEEIERRLELPLLSRLPEPSRRLEKQGLLAMIHDPHDRYAEAVRRLRTNLEFANVDRAAQVIMVTSAVEREGKSTTIANLAVALARSGRSVALVDLDLRRPVLAGFFNLEGRPGITDVVLERTALEIALVPIQLPASSTTSFGANGSAAAAGRLSVLPSGRLPANPGELVGTQALGRILERLRAEHDYVLLDAAPLLSVGDSMTLSARADAVLLVVRLGLVNRPMLAEVSRELAGSPAQKLGFVVTGSDTKAGYGYGYGYGHRPEVEEAPTLEVAGRQATRRAERRAAAGR